MWAESEDEEEDNTSSSDDDRPNPRDAQNTFDWHFVDPSKDMRTNELPEFLGTPGK